MKRSNCSYFWWSPELLVPGVSWSSSWLWVMLLLLVSGSSWDKKWEAVRTALLFLGLLVLFLAWLFSWKFSHWDLVKVPNSACGCYKPASQCWTHECYALIRQQIRSSLFNWVTGSGVKSQPTTACSQCCQLFSQESCCLLSQKSLEVTKWSLQLICIICSEGCSRENHHVKEKKDFEKLIRL